MFSRRFRILYDSEQSKARLDYMEFNGSSWSLGVKDWNFESSVNICKGSKMQRFYFTSGIEPGIGKADQHQRALHDQSN